MKAHQKNRLAFGALAVFWAALMVTFILSVTGCQTPNTPKQRLATAELAFTAVVSELADLRIAGVINKNKFDNIVKPIVNNGNELLNQHHVALATGQTVSMTAIQNIITTLKNLVKELINDSTSSRPINYPSLVYIGRNCGSLSGPLCQYAG